MRNVLVRISVWASAGFLVSLGWGLYFAKASKNVPIEAAVYALAKLSQPLIAAYFYVKPNLPIGLTWAAVANAVFYALLGLIVEMVRRHYRSLEAA